MPRILVVEDHPMIRSSISEDLALEGYEVLVAEDGGEGVEIARSKAPDLILMDMELRDVHGWEATRRLKANPETEAIPIIALTGHTESDEQEEIMKAGCDDFEPKPINHPRLLDKIKALLEVKVRRAISDEQTGQAGGGYGYTSEANRVRRTSPDVLRYEAGMLTSAIIEHSRTLLNEVADHGSKKPCSYLGIHSEGKQLLALVNDVLSPTARVADSKPDDLRHDLRSLITGILSCSRLLEKEAKVSGQSDVTFRLQEIRSASERFIPLIDQVVNFSRVEAGEKVPRSQASNTETIEQDDIDSLEDAGEEVQTEQGTLLIVDDNEMIRDVLARQLGKQGYKTDVAENGRQALDMIQNQKPDLLLLDIRMTEMDGKDVLKHLKNSPDLRDIPLIMVSALDEIESVVECMKMGAEDYVLQPFDPVLLQARIKKVLENKRLREREAKFDDFTKTVREMLEEFDKREDQMLVKLLEPEGFKKVHRVHRELDELHSRTDDEP